MTALRKYATTPVRRGLIAKIKIGQKQLGIDDDAYRQMLENRYGVRSATNLIISDLEDLLNCLKDKGFKPSRKPSRAKSAPRRAGSRPLAVQPLAKKIRALWLNLYHLGVVLDPSEEALAKYVKRMSGADALQWLDAAQADRVIKALRGWCERIGFHLPDSEAIEAIHSLRADAGMAPLKSAAGFAAKVALIKCQWEAIGGSPSGVGAWLARRAFSNNPKRLEEDPIFMDEAAADLAIEALSAALRVPGVRGMEIR
ncbi:MAG: hypothetical protein COA65_08990 [Rhodospirillaceae bacterium]|nr:MAG: hypothetical protein COA65_08990 [Rhodospirillaceae bacterium]